jgi:hypothetical protein
MKIGDLCKVIKKNTHKPCQYGDYVVILKPLGKTWRSKTEYWAVHNVATGQDRHFKRTDLEVVCK